MKKLISVLALMLVMLTAAARADRVLYVGAGTVSRAQAQALAAMLTQSLGEKFVPLMEADCGESLAERLGGGLPPQLAIVRAEQALPWAREGMLLPLDGHVPGVKRVAQPLLDACVADEQLFAAPLLARAHSMAVRVPRFEQAKMAYMLDLRAHPVWYPSEMMQALDELALEGEAGLDVWLPSPGDDLWLRALLQGVTGLELADMVTGEYAADRDALEAALAWLGDMHSAGLIAGAQNRSAALARFLAGETAVFVDWTPAESEAYAREIEAGRIVLLPYPSMVGMAHHAVDLIAVCALRGEAERENALLQRAVSLLFADEKAQVILGERGVYRDGAPWMPILPAQDYGATLSHLFSGAAAAVLGGEAPAAAAGEVDRAMDALGGA